MARRLQQKRTVGLKAMKHANVSGGCLVSANSTYLTRTDVALLLGVSPNTVTRWAREGRLPCHLTLGGHHRFERSRIEEIRRGLCHEAEEALVAMGTDRAGQ
jgi:excisionase family DNA binding protein